MDGFTLAASAEANNNNEWGVGGSIGTEVSDGVSLNLGARYYNDNDPNETLTQIAAQIVASVTDEVTLTGEGKCAKCALKKSDTCQNVVEVKKGDKTTLYYLTGDASKGFHKNLCSGSAKVKVSGKASEKDGKNELEVTKIEPGKQPDYASVAASLKRDLAQERARKK